MNAPDDVWAGGFQGLWHWDGTSWTHTALPPEAEATVNDIAFWDADHGIAVSGWTGTPPPGVNPEVPLILAYRNGSWARVPVASLPEGFVRVTLGSVRMTGPDEAWGIGAGFDLVHGIIDRPVLMRIRLPADPAPPPVAAMAAAAVGAGSSSLEVTKFRTSERSAGTAIEVETNRPAAGVLVIYTPGMVRLRSFPLTGSASHSLEWDGRDSMGRDAGWGWYQAIAEFPEGDSVVRAVRWVLRVPVGGTGRTLVRRTAGGR